MQHFSFTRESSLILWQGVVMLWVFASIFLALWLIGVVGEVGGQLVHWLLAIGLVIVIADLVLGRRPVL